MYKINPAIDYHVFFPAHLQIQTDSTNENESNTLVSWFLEQLSEWYFLSANLFIITIKPDK